MIWYYGFKTVIKVCKQYIDFRGMKLLFLQRRVMWDPYLATTNVYMHRYEENEPIRRRHRPRHNATPEPNNLCYWNEVDVNGRQAFPCVKYLSFKELRPVTAEGETIKYWRLLEGSVNSRKYLDNCWDCGLGKATLWTPYLICQRSVFRITSKSLLNLSQLRGFKPLGLFVITYSFGICQQLYTETLLKQFTSAGVLQWVLRNPSKEPYIFLPNMMWVPIDAWTRYFDSCSLVVKFKFVLFWANSSQWAICIWWKNGNSPKQPVNWHSKHSLIGNLRRANTTNDKEINYKCIATELWKCRFAWICGRL